MMGNECLVWAEPLSRGDLRLGPGDIGDAIKHFQKKYKRPPALIELCPKNAKFAREVPEGTAIEYRGGVLLGEIWLSGKNGGSTEILEMPPDALQSTTRRCQNKTTHNSTSAILATPARTGEKRKTKRHKIGRKRLKLPEARISAMYFAGMNARQITAKLDEKYGIKISCRAVARFISMKKQSRLLS